MRRIGISSLALLVLIALVGILTGPATAQTSDQWYQRGAAMKPRLQWNANYGYCGETSFIEASMFYGQYSSQWTVRHLASPHKKQTREASQLLLGKNELRAAHRMKLVASRYDNSKQHKAKQFLAWSKRQFLRDHVVIMGVFNNVNTLGESPSLADPEYDHIVVMQGVGSATPFSDSHAYRKSDSIIISDNGLYSVGSNYPFLFSYRMSQFIKTRKEANHLGGNLYSLKKRPPNYGVAIRGIADRDGDTVPIRLTSDARGEGVQNQAVMTHPPKASRIHLTATTTLPEKREYKVYMYNSFADVPTHHFNASAERASKEWTIPASHSGKWSKRISVMSDQTRVFRVVPSSAP